MTLTEDMENDRFIADILSKSKTIAMVGASQNWKRPSNFVMKYLQRKGYKIIPVNPKEAGKEIHNELCYASLKDIPINIDMVDVFRSSKYVFNIAKEAISINANILWTQEGVVDDDAADFAKKEGLIVIMSECPKKILEKSFK